MKMESEMGKGNVVGYTVYTKWRMKGGRHDSWWCTGDYNWKCCSCQRAQDCSREEFDDEVGYGMLWHGESAEYNK
jgi:hypothetical protein